MYSVHVYKLNRSLKSPAANAFSSVRRYLLSLMTVAASTAYVLSDAELLTIVGLFTCDIQTYCAFFDKSTVNRSWD